MLKIDLDYAKFIYKLVMMDLDLGVCGSSTDFGPYDPWDS